MNKLVSEMYPSPFERLYAYVSKPEEMEATIDYLTEHLRPIVKSSEATLICFPKEKKTDFGSMVGQAVMRCGGHPVFWELDLHWKTLLRLAFCSKASTIIATPLILLGMTKIAIHEKIPLHFYNVVLAGYPCVDWIRDGIAKGLDCTHWGVFSPGNSCVIGGFACLDSPGIHLRSDKFTAHIVDELGEPLPDTQMGAVVLRWKEDPQAWMNTGLLGCYLPGRCTCGNPAPRLEGLGVARSRELESAMHELLRWGSVLDAKFTRTDTGLELQVVYFAGEKLPKPPACARVVTRPWNSEVDCPLPLGAGWSLMEPV